MPGLKTTTYGAGDYSWLLNTHGWNAGGQGVLDISAFTAGTHYPLGYIRSGTPVNAADRAALKPWTDTAGAILAFVDGDQPVNSGEDLNVALVTHADGIIKANVPVTFATPTTAPQPQFGQYL